MTEAAQTTAIAKADLWKDLCTRATIIYRIVECGDKIPMNLEGTHYEFIEGAIDSLDRDGFLEVPGLEEPQRKELWQKIRDRVLRKEDVQVTKEIFWKVTKKGDDFLKSMVAVVDHCLKFEIYTAVSLNIDIEDIADGEGGVQAYAYDPRFDKENASEDNGTVDLRLAMLRFKSEEAAAHDKNLKPINPYVLVFCFNWLKEGLLNRENVWFDLKLGTIHDEVRGIVDTAFQWRKMHEDPDLAKEAMEHVYTAGMVEEQKRSGNECSECETPLALYDRGEDGRYEKLTHCPMDGCKVELDPPPEDAEEFECPNCNADIHSEMSNCPGCFADLDYTLPPGTIQNVQTTETVEETTEECYAQPWGCYSNYGYAPIPLYDPYDSLASSLLLGAAFADLAYCSAYPMYDDPFDPWDNPYSPWC